MVAGWRQGWACALHKRLPLLLQLLLRELPHARHTQMLLVVLVLALVLVTLRLGTCCSRAWAAV